MDRAKLDQFESSTMKTTHFFIFLNATDIQYPPWTAPSVAPPQRKSPVICRLYSDITAIGRCNYRDGLTYRPTLAIVRTRDGPSARQTGDGGDLRWPAQARPPPDWDLKGASKLSFGYSSCKTHRPRKSLRVETPCKSVCCDRRWIRLARGDRWRGAPVNSGFDTQPISFHKVYIKTPRNRVNVWWNSPSDFAASTLFLRQIFLSVQLYV